MIAYWTQWYLEHDPMLMHFVIRRNESRTHWDLRGEGKHLMSCPTWDEAVDAFYAFMPAGSCLTPPIPDRG